LKGFWRISRGLCVDTLKRFFPSSDTKEHGHGPTRWALDMMMMMMIMTCRQSDNNYLLLKLSFFVASHFF